MEQPHLHTVFIYALGYLLNVCCSLALPSLPWVMQPSLHAGETLLDKKGG